VFNYIRDPREIYNRSFETLREITDTSHLPERLVPVAERLVHACGIPEITDEIAWSGDPVSAGSTALANGKPILVDTQMVGAGIMRARLPSLNEVVCLLHDPRTSDLAVSNQTTRSAAAIDLWLDHIEGAIAVFGNAPTALFRLLELLKEGSPKPALILGFPVGFIGAAESKEALIQYAGEIPFITLRGRLGGSAMAAASVNALILGAFK